MIDVWSLVHAERASLIADLSALAAEQWETPSGSAGWSVHDLAGRTSTPPAPLASRLVEEIVHGEDIRRPLGIAHDYPAEAIEAALRLQARTSQSFGGAKELVAKVRLVATDTDFAVGQGAVITGPALSLLLVTTGRGSAVTDLNGEGLLEL